MDASNPEQVDLSRPGKCKVCVGAWLEASSFLQIKPWLNASNPEQMSQTNFVSRQPWTTKKTGKPGWALAEALKALQRFRKALDKGFRV